MEDLIAIIIFAVIMLVSFAAKAIGAVNKAAKGSEGSSTPGTLADFLRELTQSGVEVRTGSGPAQRKTSTLRSNPRKIQKQSLIEDPEHDCDDAFDLPPDSPPQPPALLPTREAKDQDPPGVAVRCRSDFARDLLKSRRFAILSHEILGTPKGFED